MKDKNGIGYDRKEMMMTGSYLGIGGTWSEGQLTDEIQHIIENNQAQFDGLEVNPEDIETKSESESDSDQIDGKDLR